MLDGGISADLLDLRCGSGNAAFDVIDVFETGIKHRFLLGAVGTPIRPVHLYIVLFEAARELVITVRATIVADKICRSERGDNDPGDYDFTNEGGISLRFRFAHGLPLFA